MKTDDVVRNARIRREICQRHEVLNHAFYAKKKNKQNEKAE
jgi:hypothetical protein